MHFRWHRVNIVFLGKQWINRENRRDNQEWTIQRHQQQSTHETQEFLKESTTVVIKITSSVCVMLHHNYHSLEDIVKMLDLLCIKLKTKNQLILKKTDLNHPSNNQNTFIFRLSKQLPQPIVCILYPLLGYNIQDLFFYQLLIV